MNETLQQAFASWADRVMAEHDGSAVAYLFNLYEHVDAFAIQIVGTRRFDSINPDWVWDEVFSSGEDLFLLPRTLAADDWQEGLAAAKSLVLAYLRTGTHAKHLRSAEAVGIGFVDGDLEVLTTRGNRNSSS